MGGLPLGTPRHHRHGGPLPRRLANVTRAHPQPPQLYTRPDAGSRSHAGLAAVSAGFPPVAGRLLTRYAPFRRSPAPVIADRPAAPRLACVRPAASVHPEPGSNSSSYIISISLSRSVCSRFLSSRNQRSLLLLVLTCTCLSIFSMNSRFFRNGLQR